MSDAPLELRALAAYGLPGGRLVLPEGPLDEQAFAGLFHGAVRQRLLGLLAAALADDALAVTPWQYEQVAHAHAVAMDRALDIEEAALHAIAILEAAGVQVRVLKGVATARLDFTDPARREFTDVDLLVEPGRFDDAVRALTLAGMPRDLPQRRPGFDQRFGKEATLYGRHQVEIDLHRMLALGVFGLALDPRWLWDGGDGFDLGDRRLRALSPEARLVHACYASMLADHSPRLVALRDAAQLAGRAGIDGERVVALARRGGGACVVALALRRAGETLGVGPEWSLWEWAMEYRTGRWERACLRAYESQGGSNTATILSGVLGLHGVRSRLAYATALAFPSKAYVQARRRMGRPGEWRQGISDLVRSLPARHRRHPVDDGLRPADGRP